MRLGSKNGKREGYEKGERKHEGTGDLSLKGYRKTVNMETLNQDYVHVPGSAIMHLSISPRPKLKALPNRI